MDTTLAIRVLEITEYPPKGHGYATTIHPHPTWDQVESAIRALNHYCLPFFFIGLRDSCEGEDCFSVLGGPNGYAFMAEVRELGWVQYCNPLHTGGRIDVWTSDQGFYPEERFVTYDIDLVIRLTRYYAEHGQLDPSVIWDVS